MNPLISICIPTYNGDPFLKEALDSINNQKYLNIEVIISDDNSNNKTKEILDAFRIESNFPVKIYNHTQSTIGSNWNNCLIHANGKYIKFLFQDDILYPNCVEEMVKVLESNKTIGLVACKREFILEDPNNEKTKKWVDNYKDLQGSLNLSKSHLNFVNKNFLKSELFLKDPLNKIGEPTCVMFRKSILKETGLFNESLKQVLDCEFYYRILKTHQIAIINVPLVNFRIHSKQATNINRISSNNDRDLYSKILYKDFFWNLHYKYQKKLFLQYNPIGKILKIVYQSIFLVKR